MNQSLGVPCSGAQGSEGSQSCLSLWLSLFLNLRLQLMMRLQGTSCFNGSSAYFTIPPSSLLYPTFSLLISSQSFVCVPYFLRDVLLTGACCQSLAARTQPLLHTSINRAAAARNARCFLLIFKAPPLPFIDQEREKQWHPSCRRHSKPICYRGDIIRAVLHIKHQPPFV